MPARKTKKKSAVATEPKKKKSPSLYCEFIRKHYDSVRDKPVRERLKILAKRWATSDENPNKKSNTESKE
jgi:hypothetical protein